MERRLAAILAADVVGYSRLMERDEASTLEAMKSRWSSVVEPLIGSHQGRIFKETGDGVLAEFASAVDAVALRHRAAEGDGCGQRGPGGGSRASCCASASTSVTSSSTAATAMATRSTSRRGSRLGEPGGICISGTVHEHVERKLDVAVADLGPQVLKNIERPVRVFRVLTGAETAALCSGVASWRQTVDSGSAIGQHEQRPGTGILRRRHHRGYPDRAVALPGPVRDLAQLGDRL